MGAVSGDFHFEGRSRSLGYPRQYATPPTEGTLRLGETVDQDFVIRNELEVHVLGCRPLAIKPGQSSPLDPHRPTGTPIKELKGLAVLACKITTTGKIGYPERLTSRGAY